MSFVYVDSSALVKLVVAEAGSSILKGWLRGRSVVSSSIARVEVERAVRRIGATGHPTSGDVLGEVDLVACDDVILASAATLDPIEMRSLDAIHLATALRIVADLDAFVTYDRQLGRSAVAAGLRVESPR
jgi:predicted nucleic acid-binding protein